MTLEATPFPPEALEANRRGVLTDAQRRAFTPGDRGRRGHDRFVAAFFVLLAVVVLLPGTPVRSAAARPLVALGALAAAALIIARPTVGYRRRIDRDLRRGHVASVEGAIAKSTDSVLTTPSLPGSRRYYLEIAGQTLHTSVRGYEAAPEAGFVRAYYLPTSQLVVNLERLPDQPLPRELLDSPGALLTSLGTALGLHGQTAAAEARAGLSALFTSLAPESGAATPPPPEQRDARPLAQAILGSWRSGMFDLTFSSDGIVTLKGLGGRERQGRWSVDAAGRLRSDAMGADQTADAWIAGDILTISADGTALALRRA